MPLGLKKASEPDVTPDGMARLHGTSDARQGSLGTFDNGFKPEKVDLSEESGIPPYERASISAGEVGVVSTAEDLVTSVISVSDDPTLNPWTFRMFFLGIGLAVFGSVLQEIFYFKPQVIYVSVIFLTVIAYVLGEAMAVVIPRWGPIGRFLNPHPFNMKEHAAIALMASSAAVSALATEALAAQALYYGGYPNRAGGIFITLSSQLIGYGIAGCMRSTLVYPTKMLYPANLPLTTMLETLHKDKSESRVRLKVFYAVFVFIFFWEILPEYIFPVLTGVSVFCLAKRDSLVFTNLFGGANGNEGLGFLSVCFDWNYIAGLGSPLWVPLQTLVNSCIGYLGCTILLMGLYYGNVYKAQNFPFLAQVLFTDQSNSTSFDQFNQTLILNPDHTVNLDSLAATGLPNLTASYLGYLITTNMGITATLVHMLLWNYDDIKSGWSFLTISNIKKIFKKESWRFWDADAAEKERQRIMDDPDLDPHYKLILRYPDSPTWWFAAIALVSFVVSMICLYVVNSTLSWWGFIVACLLLIIFILFFGAQYAITGFQFNQQPVAQMLGGYMFPGKPVANMYFSLFAYNAVGQGQLLLRDLKLAQYVHLQPRCTFTVQVIGCTVGALFNYIMMLSIVQNQREILLSIEGTNIWSGQNVQQFNTLAIAWAIAKDMFSIGGRYEWVTIAFLLGFIVPFPFWIIYRYYPIRFFSYINLAIILWYMGWLFVGINSSCGMYFVIGFLSQFYIRRRFPQWFIKYNYLLSAALDGGTQVMVFVFTFAVFGGSGKSHPFPNWAGNPVGNLDYCKYNEANG